MGQILVRDRSGADRRPAAAIVDGWRPLGLFGVLLTVAGLADVLLYWYPLGVGSPEWEFGTAAASISALPLTVIGLAVASAAAVGSGWKTGTTAMGALLLVLALLVGAAYVLFMMNVPFALAASQEGPQGPAIFRAIVRTSIMGVGFGAAFLVGGIWLLRNLSQRSRA
jgi:hypothetical protein